MGGMAVVYRALDTQSNREVALKILLPQFVDDQTFLQRFLREGQNTKRLRHPHIVRTFDAGMVDSYYYIAMELIEGSNLADYVKEHGALLDFRESIDILSQVSAALDYAHSLGFLHRDIKLTNILISQDGRALLSDFGAAKHLSSDYTMLTSTGQSIGTPSYMSPEQARAEVNLDFGTDIYSLGVVAFKLFTGRMPYVADSQPELLYKIVYDEVPDPQLYNEDISIMLANVLKRVLSKQPRSRYESAGAFIGAVVASKRWRLNLAEDLTKAVGNVQETNLKKKRPWRGLSLAICALATVIIVLAFSSSVRTQDLYTIDLASLADGSVNEAVDEVIAEVSESLPGIDFLDVSAPNVNMPTASESSGEIDVRELAFSGEKFAEYFEQIPGREWTGGFGDSLRNILPGWMSKVKNETGTMPQLNAQDASISNEKPSTNLYVETASKPPLSPILPHIPAPQE